MKIYLATWLLEVSQGNTLTNKKANTRLISYYHTKEKPTTEIKEYVKSGKNENILSGNSTRE